MKLLFTTLLGLLAMTVNAGTIIVTNTNDTGLGSLRQAVNDANANDTIRFDATLISSGNATLTLASEIAFSKALVIKGLYNTTDTLYISGGNTNRHFNITSAGKVTLDSLVLINGNTTGNGGAIVIEKSDTLFVEHSIVRNNHAVNYGGGIAYYSASSPSFPCILSVKYSTISGNMAGFGGGIFSSVSSSNSSVLVSNSVITGNQANNGSGGGIYSNSPSGISTVFVEKSTISDNHVYNNGGGIYSSSSTSSSFVMIINSTISGNIAESSGAGIYSNSTSTSVNSSVVIKTSTISDNSAINGDGGGILSNSNFSSNVSILNSTINGNSVNEDGHGCSIYAYAFSNSSTVETTSSIIWANEMSNIFNGGSSPTFISHGNNIFSDSPLAVDASDSVNVSNARLNLQPLAFNGGTTQTLLPGAGSIAVDGGNLADNTDAQNRTIVGRRDIGAAERSCSVTLNEIETACESFTWRDGITYTADTSNVWFEVKGVAAGGCDSLYSLSLTIHTIDVTTTQNGSDITANATGASYQWIDCDDNNTPITGETSQTFTTISDGSYAVIVSKNGCSDTSACLTVSHVGLNNSTDNTGISIFPNPTKNEVTISIENMQNGPHSIELLDATGRLISTQSMNKNATTISLSNYEVGVYIIRIMNGNTQSVHRVIKE